MSNLLADRHRKKNLLSQKRHVEFENTFLDMAQMYCCIGNYSQAFDWCLSYLECAQPNEQLSYILEMILLKSHSAGLKQQVSVAQKDIRRLR
ncbi:MAG: hypothetical protein CMF49_02920 [Legionellales bacterium]|nr:hypothetical protein [Legionellales bacterium]|tara:strand:+ start:475 stop:750 length:276 start_codon:yes stop_codon:yes gene_type:complete